MSDIPLPSFERASRWHFDWVLPVLFRPRRIFDRVTAVSDATWQTPILILAAAAVIQSLVAGGIKQAAAASGQITLPPGFEYYTPEQQAQFYQAMNATSGPVFTYLLPAVMALLGVYLGWLVLGWVLHLILTMLGGRGSSRQVLNIVAWASLPFAIRSAVRIVAMWNSGQLLTYLGLSGFAPADGGALALYLSSLLTHVDLYLFWFILLLGIGVRAGDNLTRFKGWTAVFLTVIVLTLLRAVPALLVAQFSDVTVIRPFF